MNTKRLGTLACLCVLLCTLEPAAFGQQMRDFSSSMRDRILAQSPKTGVVVNGFCFELRAEAKNLYQSDPRPFELLADAANGYGSILSYGDFEAFQVYGPWEMRGGSTARFPKAIAIGYEDMTFLNEQPELYREHLLQVFLHEFGHKVWNGRDHEPVRKLYEKVVAETRETAKTSAFFVLFTDSSYETVTDGCGHPWDSADELFASAFMLVILHPDELCARIAASKPSEREHAEELFGYMRDLTRDLPKAKEFLAQ